MPTSYGALCSDFYINSKITVRMDLPAGRETVLELFDRIRRDIPTMKRFRRYDTELVLESPREDEGPQQWLSLRRTSLRAGVLNPESLGQAYGLHSLVHQVAPFYLGISPLDVSQVEVVFGFDLDAPGNHHAIVHNALMSGGPLAKLAEGGEGVTPIEFEPLLAVTLSARGDTHAIFEVKPRLGLREGGGVDRDRDEPISVYLTVRRVVSPDDIKDLPRVFSTLSSHAERLTESRVIPHLITPLRETIASQRF